MSDTISELVVNFTSTEPRFETPGDDPRLFKGTAEALKELAAGPPLEFPNEDWSREQLKDWFRTIDPAIGAVWAAWAGEIPAEIAECVEKTDLEHKGIPVRILKKKSTSDDLPVVVYYHGGGLSVWSAKDPVYDAYLTRLAALGSCIIVAVDYRLTRDAPFPACLEDSYMAAKWVSEGGAISSGVPKGNVVIAGDSAGANLSFGVALKAKKAGKNFVRGLYLICPFSSYALRETDEGRKYPSMSEFNGYFLSDGFFMSMHMGACDESEKEMWFKSPLLWPICATKEDMAGLPPTSVIVGELDMVRDMGIDLNLRLKEAGVEASLTMIGGGIHDQQLFTKHSPQVTNQSIHDLAAFARYVAGDDKK
jgi:acetyl esterase/lipase